MNAYLEIRALEWGLYPEPRIDFKGPFEGKVRKLKKKKQKKYAKYLGRTKAYEAFKDRCPRDIDLVEMWGQEPINLRNLVEDKTS